MTTMTSIARFGALVATAAMAAGCVTAPATVRAPAPASAPAASMASDELYVVLPENGRVYAFGDTKNYFDFMKHGEVVLTRTQIGAGPGGKTLVYGITKADVKANRPSRGEEILQGKTPPAGPFYGEAFKSGRYYLFGDLKDMKDFTAFGEVPYSYTEIGAGPNGETLVHVMNKKSYAKGKPVERVERFKALRMGSR